MLPFFPSPYPDELLYSTCARFHARSINRCLKDTIQDLFGSRTAVAVVDLPNRLAYLSSQLSPRTLNTPDKLIYDHTLLPLYRPFLPEDRLNRILGYMKGSANGGAIHMAIGAMASSIPSLPFLRWCPDCITADRKDWGEPYWHRSHQVMGVTVCHAHGTVLRENDELLISDMNKHLFRPFPDIAIQGHPLCEDIKGSEHHLAIAKDVSWLLKNYDTQVLGLNALHDRYVYFLKRLDLATYSGRIEQHELLDAFTTFDGRSFLDKMYSAVDRSCEDNWLSFLVRKPRRNRTTHPVRHLLLIHFLGLDVNEFFAAKAEGKGLFGVGPWPCLNPVAPHYHQPVITECSVTTASDTGKPIGNFYCTCGFNYARTGPDIHDDDKFRHGRMLNFGFVWEAELLHLAREENLSLRATARRLGVACNTVKRHLCLLEIGPRQVSGPVKEKEQLQAYRSRWLQLCLDNGGMGRGTLRVLDPAAYGWLYRNDREWLFSHPEGSTVRNAPPLRIDWMERDRKISAGIIAAADAIRSQPGRPVRITLPAIGKKLRILGVLEKNLVKLPETAAALQNVMEDQNTYSIRRVRYAVTSIVDRGDPLLKWRVVREAGLGSSSGYSAEVEREIRRAIAAGIVGEFP